MKRAALGALLAFVAALGFTACEASRSTRKARNEVCQKNLDCAYGLECAEAQPSADGGTPIAGRTCQFKSFGDCEGDGPGPNGQPQCVSGQRCRDGHCTVQCAGKDDCGEGQICKVGVCQKGSGSAVACYDNRDCNYPETCFWGQCVVRTESMRCQTDLDCGTGFRCINGRCQ